MLHSNAGCPPMHHQPIRGGLNDELSAKKISTREEWI